ncbi:hypothetical protein AWH69_07930 [Janibacter melonis]|uniref:Major facilitator superfamily (MFS) profile domain-containing protein n=1 Tax=Janibacter melonis TaxID=262209 RepID=A0A176QDU6_9MICO|nr:MFS transporter [Janibacter melonis]OAB87937.1 hypothetical protein AWH69_07930 [Janibacter melonis]
MTTAARTSAVPQERAHRALLLVFALAGVVFATWASRLPDIKSMLGLTSGELGITLLAGSVGSLLALPLAGRLAERVGTGRAVVIGAVLACVGILGVGLGAQVAGSRPLISAGLFVTSAGVSLWDVSMNLQGTTVERALGRSTMPLYHAFFSGGTVLAALVGAGLVALGVSLLVHFVVVVALAATLALRTQRHFLADPRLPDEPGTTGVARSAWREPRTALIGVFVLVAAFTEGTANDWIAVAFVDGHGVPTWAGVVAFACFLGAMTLGRVLGTRLLDVYGRRRVLLPMLVVAAVGSLLVVLTPPATAYVGTLLWGFGVSLGFPVGMSAAADDPRRAAARMSVVATIGYAAFIAGPPVLGLLGDHVGILRALLLVAVMILLALVTLPAVVEPDDARAPRPTGSA